MAAVKTGNIAHLETWGVSGLQCTPPSRGSDFGGGVPRTLGSTPTYGGVNNIFALIYSIVGFFFLVLLSRLKRKCVATPPPVGDYVIITSHAPSNRRCWSSPALHA